MHRRWILLSASAKQQSLQASGAPTTQTRHHYLLFRLFSLSFLSFSMYTNVTTIKSTICSPSANISSEAERGSVSTPNRRQWYTATRISFPSASITSYNEVLRKSKECDDTRTHLRNPPTHLPLILLPIRRCETPIPSLQVNTHTHCTISL